jgi:hypothetical protein
MSWGDTGGAGVGTNVGSPEAERGARGLGDDGPRPPDDDPRPRPGCLRTMVTLAIALILISLVVFLAGLALDRL